MGTPGLRGRVNPTNPVNWAHPANKGLAGWWAALPGQGGGTKLYDLTRVCAGTLANGPSWGTGPPAEFAGLTFNGTSTYIDVSAFPTVLGSVFSVGMWLRTTIGSLQVAAGNNALQWWMGSGFSVNGIVWTAGAVLSAPAGVGTDGAWHWCQGTQNGTAVELWVDGVRQATGSGSLTASGAAFAIGAFGTTAGYYWNGGIGGMRLHAGAVPDPAGEWAQASRGYPDALGRWPRRAWVFGGSVAAPAAGGFVVGGGVGSNVIGA